MSTERRFSEPLQRCRRSWRGQVWDGVLLLAGPVLLLAGPVLLLLGVIVMAALMVGLLHVMEWLIAELLAWHAAAGISHGVTSAGMGLAMAPVSQGMVTGALLSLSALAIALAVRRLARGDAEAAENRSRQNVGAPSKEDPLALPATGMSHEDLRRILAAMIAEASEARKMVSLAAADLSVEDYGERLHGAAERIHGVVVCLGEWVRRQEDAEAARRAAVAEHGERIKTFVSALIVRRQSMRGYHSTAAAYRPEHGGYAS